MDERERQCIKCKELWPDDTEFYNPGKSLCIACEKEPKKYQINSILQMPAATREMQMQKCRQARAAALTKESIRAE